MPTDPTLKMTFKDMCIRVAEHLSFAYHGANGNEAAQLPIDVHDLELCKRLVNDGWREFVDSNALWNWMSPAFTITFDSTGAGSQCVNGKNWRYYMPDGFYGQMIGWFTYDPDDNLFVRALSQTNVTEVMNLQGTADVSGTPNTCAIRHIAEDKIAKQATRWELIIYPKPGANYTIEGRCRIYPNQLVDDGDIPNCGFQFSGAVLAAALFKAEEHEDKGGGPKSRQWEKALVRAITIDSRSAPPRIGEVHRRARRDWYTGVDTYNNVSVGEPT